MTAITPASAAAAHPHDPAQARRLSRSIREAREKLAYESGHRPEFDYELLTMFAQSELSAALTVPLIAIIVALGLMFWAPTVPVAIWLSAVLVSKGILLSLCRQFRKQPRQDVNIASWRTKLAAAEFFYGASWASVGLIAPTVGEQSAHMFVFSVLVVIMAMRILFTSSIMPVVYAGTVPMTAALVLRFGLLNDPFYWAMAAMAVGIHVYFIYLSKRMNKTVLNMLGFRAEKDALIAELEQSKSISDEARRRAEEANFAKSRFLATMSHELRTPLNAILGFSEVMQGEILGPHAVPTYKEYAGDIHRSGQHLLNLINEILDLSRIEAGRYELHEDAVCLADVVEDCLRLLKLRAESKGLRLVESFAEGMANLWADERATRQVCLNLLSNAIKFTPSGGTITIAIGPTQTGGQYLSVKDTGPGIPEHEIPRVLKSFGQGSLAHQTAEGGTGLGLPIVQGLMELHEGAFELRSKLRVGTEVIVAFPKKRVMQPLPRLAEPGETPPRRWRGDVRGRG